MVFDADQQKAVRKRTIPPPSAMSFNSSLTYDEVLKIGKESYFPELDCSLESFCLGDASGVLYQIKDKATWTLSQFVKEVGVAPSKLRLYVVFRPEEDQAVTEEGEVEGNQSALSKRRSPPPLVHSESDGHSDSDSNILETEPVIQNCISCSKPYRTYIPNTNCTMVDGTSFCYRDPQNECPECDENNWGWYWNIDLFPQFASWKTH
jgi:hypothetical protein